MKQDIDIIDIQRNEFSISTDVKKLDVLVIHDYLSNEAYWSPGIPLEKIEQAIESSLNFGLYFQTRQIGYARIISDYTTMAYLCDVYVLAEFRGKALGKWLIETVMEHPNLQGLRRWMLRTRDAHGLYEQFGWKKINDPSRWMEITRNDIYQRR